MGMEHWFGGTLTKMYKYSIQSRMEWQKNKDTLDLNMY